MRKSYVMVYATAFGQSHTNLTTILDNLDPACDWHVPMANCLLFTSTLKATQLAKHFEDVLGVGPGKLYLITEVSSNNQGRLPDRGWKLLNNPDNPRGS